jgi:adenine-specific DNA-methyltransferase
MKAPASCVVYTPGQLASAMAESLQPTAEDTFLDPCVGRGALVRALAEKGVNANRIRALDLDSKPLESDRLAEVIRGQDYLQWASTTGERFSKIIANPPYLALNRLRGMLRKNAQLIKNPFNDEVLPLTGNYWHSFLCASLKILEVGGSVCFLLPAAWDYSNYSRQLREELPRRFSQVRIHRSRIPLFMGLQEGSVLLLAKGYMRKSRVFVRCEHRSLKDLVAKLSVHQKVSAATSSPVQQRVLGDVRLDDVLRVGIGAVTGDSKYFLMTEKARKQRRLPISTCLPVLTRASQLRSHLIEIKDWQTLRKGGERIWLFRPKTSETHRGPVQSYLRLGVEKGGCRRSAQKVRGRTPWYQTILPDVPHGFMSGMATGGPWISISGMAGLGATNTLYTVTFVTADTLAEKCAVAITLMTSRVRAQLELVGRRYADGLVKFEPIDLKAIWLPKVTRIDGAVLRYKQIVKLWVCGDRRKAERLADDWVASSTTSLLLKNCGLPREARRNVERPKEA